MAACGSKPSMDFVPMKSIGKTTDDWDDRCTHWVATEKIHGTSFQLYTNDGIIVHTGSRRRNLDHEASFLKCNIADFVEEYRRCVIKCWHAIASDDRWNRHREISKTRKKEEDTTDSTKNTVSAGDDKSTQLNNIECCQQRIAGKQHRHVEMGIALQNYEKDQIQNVKGVSQTNIQHDIHLNLKQNCDWSEHSNVTDLENQKEKEECPNDDKAEKNDDEIFQLRIYGELYGGGGVKADTKKAIQKEIIYCDDFRFYVFAVTINRKWLTISELGALCREAGFPHYAKPVNEVPAETVDDLKQWLDESGLMTRRSAMTDRTDDNKTCVEGYVLTPLTKMGYSLRAIKYLAPAFSDVRTEQRTNKKTRTIYCTKQRYHSVISKLDTDERRDNEMVIRMMEADIIADSQEMNPSKKQQKIWRKMVTQWLMEDGYYVGEGETRGRGKTVEDGSRGEIQEKEKEYDEEKETS